MKRVLIVLLYALLCLGGLFVGACDPVCDPGAFISDCPGDDSTCDAESLTCEEMNDCEKAADCPGGYVCYASGQCAKNCYAGLMIGVAYCQPGYVCDEEYRCVYGGRQCYGEMVAAKNEALSKTFACEANVLLSSYQPGDGERAAPSTLHIRMEGDGWGFGSPYLRLSHRLEPGRYELADFELVHFVVAGGEQGEGYGITMLGEERGGELSLTIDELRTGRQTDDDDFCVVGRLQAQLLPNFEATEDDKVEVDISFSCEDVPPDR